MLVLAFAVLGARSRSLDLTRPRREDLLRIALAGLTGYTLYQMGFVFGLDRTSVFAASLLVATAPLFTLVFLFVAGERPPVISWLGMAVALAGVAIFLLDKRGGERSLSGDLLCIGAAASFSIYGIINRPLVARYPAPTYTAYTMLFGSIPLLLFSLPSVRDQDWASLPTSSWVAIVYMVIFPVYIAYMLWNFGIARRGAAIASSFGMLVPVLSGILSVVFFDEQFGFAKIVGATLVISGLLLIRLGPLLLQRYSSAPAVWIATIPGPVRAGDDWQLQRTFPFQVEIADMERKGRLDPFVDRLEKEANELLDERADLRLAVLRKHLADDDLDLLRQKLLAGKEIETGVEHRERHQFRFAALVWCQFGTCILDQHGLDALIPLDLVDVVEKIHHNRFGHIGQHRQRAHEIAANRGVTDRFFGHVAGLEKEPTRGIGPVPHPLRP